MLRQAWSHRIHWVSADHTTAPALARLRQARWPQEAVVQWLNRLAPVLLIVFVLAASRADPGLGLAGRRLVVSVAVVAFVLGVFGRNATARRAGPAQVGFVVILLASSLALIWAEPQGPGAEGVLLGVVCAARLLPRRASVPVLVIAFVVLEVIAGVTNQGFGSLAVLAACAAFYGILVLAYRLAEANKQAERLLAELEQSQAAQARATGAGRAPAAGQGDARRACALPVRAHAPARGRPDAGGRGPG